MGKALAADQIEFVNLLVGHLTARGALDAGVPYECPFTDVAPHGRTTRSPLAPLV